jgi:hypothetical protein
VFCFFAPATGGPGEEALDGSWTHTVRTVVLVPHHRHCWAETRGASPRHRQQPRRLHVCEFRRVMSCHSPSVPPASASASCSPAAPRWTVSAPSPRPTTAHDTELLTKRYQAWRGAYREKCPRACAQHSATLHGAIKANRLNPSLDTSLLYRELPLWA